MGRTLRFLIPVALFALPATGAIAQQPEAVAATAPSIDPGRAACDYGMAVAFHGDVVRAESVFVQLLAQSPGDARALTNLGNLNLMRGEAEVALAFYNRASAADTTDTGILLNRATALLLLGDDEAASAQAASATARAGGVREAARLLGLRTDAEEESPKAAAKARVSQEEILRLLRAAATGVPTDSLRARTNGTPSVDSNESRPSTRRAPVWRAAGARAGDENVATMLYWKR